MRTKEGIIEQMDALIASDYPDLAKLNDNPSRVSNWNRLKGLYAQLMQIVDGLLDTHRVDVQNLIANNRAGTLEWYGRIAREFQMGVNAVPNENGQFYSTVEASRQIVKLVAVRVATAANQDLLMKVMKLVNSQPTALTASELEAFRAYMNVAKIAGVKLDVQSLPANEIDFDLMVFHNRQVINDVGQALADTSKEPVKDAVRAYLVNLPFGGSFRVASLIDFLLNQPGILNVKITNARYKDANSNWVDLDPNTLRYDPPSGFLFMTEANMIWGYTAEPF